MLSVLSRVRVLKKMNLTSPLLESAQDDRGRPPLCILWVMMIQMKTIRWNMHLLSRIICYLPHSCLTSKSVSWWLRGQYFWTLSSVFKIFVLFFNSYLFWFISICVYIQVESCHWQKRKKLSLVGFSQEVFSIQQVQRLVRKLSSKLCFWLEH